MCIAECNLIDNSTNQYDDLDFVWKISLHLKGIIVGTGVGITRDCTIVMIGQYFKKKREFVEVFAVAGSGLGILVMSTFQQKAIDTLGWR